MLICAAAMMVSIVALLAIQPELLLQLVSGTIDIETFARVAFAQPRAVNPREKGWRSMVISQHPVEKQPSHAKSSEQAAQVWTTTNVSSASMLLESLMEIAWRVGLGQSNGVGAAGQPPYSFSVEGLVDGLIAPHIALVCLDGGDIDATLAFSYDQALEYLRTRAEHWEVDPLEAFDLETATVEQLSAVYAVGHDPETTWIEIIPIEAWFGSRGWRSLV
jgi:hypothetical protein